MEMNGGFLVTKIKQLGDRIFEKILSEKNIDAFNGAQQRRRPARRRGALLRPARYLPRRGCAVVEYPPHHLGRHRRQNALPREQRAAKAAAQAYEEVPVHGAQRRL